MAVRSGEVRIIAGGLRGRKVQFPDHRGLRPTGDRVRETLFNWLHPWITGARCLDLFAGSGILGFEAASRGAAKVVMVEQAAEVIGALRANRAHLGTPEVEVIAAEALSWLAVPGQSFDLVLLDPPFGENLLGRCCERLATGAWLRPGGLVYLEADARAGLPLLPVSWSWYRQQRAGQVAFGLARTPEAAHRGAGSA